MVKVLFSSGTRRKFGRRWFLTPEQLRAAPTKLSKEYRDRLDSPAWKVLRMNVIAKRGSRCEQCGEYGSVDLHHKNYNNFGREQEQDVLLLCRTCHEQRHGGVKVPELAAKLLKRSEIKSGRPVRYLNQPSMGTGLPADRRNLRNGTPADGPMK